MIIITLVTKEVLGWRHPTYRCYDIVSNHFHLRFIKKRDYMCHKKPLSKVIVFMCSNKIMKNYCSDNNAFLNAYIIG